MKNKNMNQKALITGSAWMTAGSIFSRLLGALYVVPWGIWLGATFSQANSLFAKGYNIYSLFLIISTAGIPSALAKQIAQLEAVDCHQNAKRLVAQSFCFMLILGVVAAVSMWRLAPLLATQNGIVDVNMVKVVRTLCWPLLMIPPMSILRGYFQGHGNMGPSAVSQLIEQIARIMYLLVATYYVMQLKNGSYVDAVIHSTFAAFVGVVFALFYLLQRMGLWHKRPFQSLKFDVTDLKLFINLIHQAIPFVILNGAIVLYQFIDQYSFPILMKWRFNAHNTEINYLYGLFGFNSNKLTMIVISLATAMSATAIPLLSKLFAEKDNIKLTQQIVMILRLYFFIMLPSALGMFSLARPLYRVFYRQFNPVGIRVLALNIVVAIVIGLFVVLIAILQSVFHSRRAIQYFSLGIIVKVLLQLILVPLFGVYGPLLATAFGFGTSAVLMIFDLHQVFHFSLVQVFKFTSGNLLLAIIMAVSVGIWHQLWRHFIAATFLANCLIILTGILLGILVYAYLCLALRVVDVVLGMDAARLRKLAHIA